MREILFRGKRLNNGEWAVGFLIGVEDQVFISNLDGTSGKIELNAVEVDPATVGQYTGLKDKNGVKIFEGDLLEDKETSQVATVKYHPEVAQFWGVMANDYREIIGNIHEGEV